MNTKFSDFKPEELIGKLVLFENGLSYGQIQKSICKIIKVTKTSFKIDAEHCEDYLFDFNGYRRGLGGLHNMGTISQCELLTEAEADELRAKSKTLKESRLLREAIINKLPKLSHEVLVEIYKLV